MPNVEYEIVDVFTDRPYAGNPLAVVFDADELSGERMAAIAQEFNLSETAFVLRPSVPEADYRVRIFTPAEELPFAGHPSVGTAVTLAKRGVIGSGSVVQECGAGLLPVSIDADTATLTGAEPSIGGEHDSAPLLAAAGLVADDLVGTPAGTAGAGIPHNFLPVRADAVARASLDLAAARTNGVSLVYVFAWDAERRHAHARLFGPGVGVLEDPATGSAALGLGIWLVTVGLLPGEGESSYTIDQGVEMGRPSRLLCSVRAENGKPVETTVTGQVVPVAAGRLRVG